MKGPAYAIGNWLLYILLAFGLALWVFGAQMQPFVLTLSLSILGIIIFKISKNMRISSKYNPFISLAIWMNALCYIYLPSSIGYLWYAVHFIDAFLITLILYDYFFKNSSLKGAYSFIFLFLSVLGILALWEIYEYSIDLLAPIRLQGIYSSSGRWLTYPIDDTMRDLIIGSCGSILALFVKVLNGSRKK